MVDVSLITGLGIWSIITVSLIILYLVTLIDAVRDRNVVGFLVVFFLPVLGLLIYWLFLNKKK